MAINRRFIIGVIAVCALLWLAEAFVDSVLFGQGPFFNLLIFRVPPHEIYIRIVGIIFIIAVALYFIRATDQYISQGNKLRESREWFLTTLKSIGDAVIATDIDGRVTYSNPVACALTGWTEKEAMGRPLKEIFTLISEYTRQPVENPVTRVFNEGAIVGLANHTILIRRDGKEFPVDDSGAPIIGRDGRLIGSVLVFHEITERREKEGQLRKERDRAQQYLDLASTIMVAIGADQSIILMNRKGCEVLGYNEGELINRNWFDTCLPANMRSTVKEVFDKIITGDLAPVEYFRNPVITKSGEQRLIAWHNAVIRDDGGNIIATLSSGEDITEREAAETALQESEERFRTLFESAQDGIFIRDREGRYTAINPALESMLAVKREEVIGRTDSQAGIDLETAKSDAAVLLGRTQSNEYILNMNNQERTFHIVKVPLRNGDGSIVGICGIMRDITEMKRFHELGKRAERLEMAGRIAGQVAHDFNNLLGPLMAYPEIIKEELPPQHPAIQYIEDIERSARKIADINMQLLALGRRGHYNQEIFNLNDIVTQAVDQIRPRSRKVELITELSPSLMNIKGGVSQIFRSVSNLLTNALDATSEGDKIFIRTDNFYADTEMGEYSRIPRGEYVKLSIRDTGCGIYPENISKIFDPFFTTKSADRTRGSGLGLSVVHAVVQDHNGYIDLRSHLAEGTAFYIYFPATREKVASTGPAPGIVGGTERILVVDDDPVQCDICTALLNRLGYQVDCAASGEEALRRLRSERFDLLILDMIILDGIDGTETYRRALEINSDQKAIIISGYAESDRVRQAADLGAGEFVRKPFTFGSLVQAVRRELDRQRVTE